MKAFTIILTLFFSTQIFADYFCSGEGFEVKVSTGQTIEIEISRNSHLIADVRNVLDQSAFDIHYVGNFNQSSFDLIIKYDNSAILSIDNYNKSIIRLKCQKN